jgi:hypothetical protein
MQYSWTEFIIEQDACFYVYLATFVIREEESKRWQVNSFVRFKDGNSFVLDSGYDNVVKTEYVFFFIWKVWKRESVETCILLGLYAP